MSCGGRVTTAGVDQGRAGQGTLLTKSGWQGGDQSETELSDIEGLFQPK